MSRCFSKTIDLRFTQKGRRCGVDVLIPADRNELKMKAQRNNRIILTSGKAYDELKRLFGDRVLGIPNASALGPIDQLKFVFTRNKISFAGANIVKHDHLEEGVDIAVRKECNGTYFVKAPGPVIQALFENNVICKNGFHDEPFNSAGWTQKLNSLDWLNFSGIGCCLLSPAEGHMVVQCYGGIVNITANIVKHDHLEEGVDIAVRKTSMPDNVVGTEPI
ncbi:hypothetical protein NECAME_14441 [Necator americanus]|uniref:Uncharacterized protein n=1 Tax=Necator americanus TaxID=51031 RepID=W2SMN2_NECAM|nr:hypothetical protein NECAME_14441 [Necator americanus]ETN70954.1 hypothetical protein NECAME_14441 [Necator americanus]